METRILNGPVLVAVVVIVLLSTASVDAQLFGTRSFGRPIRPGSGTRLGQDSGTLQGNERFMRDNRSRSDFVGSDRTDQPGFVGSEQAIGVGRVPAATESLRPPVDPSSRINQPLTLPGPNEMYLPRLEIGFDVNRFVTEAQEPDGLEDAPYRWYAATNQRRAARLGEVIDPISDSPIAVSVEGSEATLRGVVPSEHVRDLILLSVSFEPGIDQIVDQLTIVPNPAPARRSND